LNDQNIQQPQYVQSISANNSGLKVSKNKSEGSDSDMWETDLEETEESKFKKREKALDRYVNHYDKKSSKKKINEKKRFKNFYSFNVKFNSF
jgi:hypothetical protein